MSCSCRAATWRAFLNGVVQVHRLESLQSPVLLRPSTFSRSALTSRSTAALQRARFVQTATNASQDATPVETPRTPAAESSPSHIEHSQWRQVADPEQQDAPKKRRLKQKTAPPDRNGEDHVAAKAKPATSTAATTKPAKEMSPEGERPPPKQREGWQIQKEALKKKFPDGWRPMKRLSPDALAGIRALNAQFPDVYTTLALSKKFEVTPEAIRRILKSKWEPSSEEEESRQQRWHRRGMSVWERKAALGVKPPQRWRQEGVVRDPSYHEWSKRARQRDREWEEEENKRYRRYRESLQSRVGGKVL